MLPFHKCAVFLLLSDFCLQLSDLMFTFHGVHFFIGTLKEILG